MTTLTPEEIRDEVLSFFEDHEDQLKSYDAQIGAIEDEGVRMFDDEVKALKERLVNDQTITEDDLQEKFLTEVEILKTNILKTVEARIQALITAETKTS